MKTELSTLMVLGIFVLNFVWIHGKETEAAFDFVVGKSHEKVSHSTIMDIRSTL